MEHLREELASRETASRTAYETSLAAAAEQAREQRLLKLEQAADADVRRHADAAEQALQRDQAAAEAAEAADRAAQAAAVARALRKP
jgi:hypothetical protein